MVQLQLKIKTEDKERKKVLGYTKPQTETVSLIREADIESRDRLIHTINSKDPIDMKKLGQILPKKYLLTYKGVKDMTINLAGEVEKYSKIKGIVQSELQKELTGRYVLGFTRSLARYMFKSENKKNLVGFALSNMIKLTRRMVKQTYKGTKTSRNRRWERVKIKRKLKAIYTRLSGKWGLLLSAKLEKRLSRETSQVKHLLVRTANRIQKNLEERGRGIARLLGGSFIDDENAKALKKRWLKAYEHNNTQISEWSNDLTKRYSIRRKKQQLFQQVVRKEKSFLRTLWSLKLVERMFGIKQLKAYTEVSEKILNIMKNRNAYTNYHMLFMKTNLREPRQIKKEDDFKKAPLEKNRDMLAFFKKRLPEMQKQIKGSQNKHKKKKVSSYKQLGGSKKSKLTMGLNRLQKKRVKIMGRYRGFGKKKRKGRRKKMGFYGYIRRIRRKLGGFLKRLRTRVLLVRTKERFLNRRVVQIYFKDYLPTMFSKLFNKVISYNENKHRPMKTVIRVNKKLERVYKYIIPFREWYRKALPHALSSVKANYNGRLFCMLTVLIRKFIKRSRLSISRFYKFFQLVNKNLTIRALLRNNILGTYNRYYYHKQDLGFLLSEYLVNLLLLFRVFKRRSTLTQKTKKTKKVSEINHFRANQSNTNSL